MTARADFFQGHQLQQSQAVSFLERPFHLLRVDHFGEVEERSGDRCDRDIRNLGAIGVRDCAFVNSDTGPLSSS